MHTTHTSTHPNGVTVRVTERTRSEYRVAKWAALGVVTVAIFAGVAIGSSWQAAVSEPAPACAYEDSAGPCFWDATRDGGEGMSFYVDENGSVYYPDIRECVPGVVDPDCIEPVDPHPVGDIRPA